MTNIKENASYLRKNLTPQEQKMWNLIRNKKFFKYKFLRQYIIDKYIVDFACREKKIVIEIDGGQHNQPNDIEYDKKRTEVLKLYGYKVIRFWNNDIDNNIEGVFEVLKKEFGVD